jgi:hypothetical protein
VQLVREPLIWVDLERGYDPDLTRIIWGGREKGKIKIKFLEFKFRNI